MRETLPLVGKHVEEIAPVFYGRMFAAHPELLRDTFNRGNQAEGGQQKVLAASVATCATLLLSLIHISEPTRRLRGSRMPSSA